MINMPVIGTMVFLGVRATRSDARETYSRRRACVGAGIRPHAPRVRGGSIGVLIL